MTPQEQQLIDELVDRIRSTNVQDKDVAAEQHLQQGLSGTPDAVYILAQTVIVQKYGLEQAQQRLQAQQSELDSLREQAAQAQAARPAGGSFLSHIFGGDSQQNQPPTAPPQQQGWQQVNGPSYGQPGYPPPPPGYGPQGYPPPNYQPGYGQPTGWGGAPSGGGGFLRGAMQTAAGVAAGAVAFEGIESLFHGFGGGGGFGGRGFEGDRPSETIINNYNDDGPRHESSNDRDDRNDRDDSSFYNPNDDASRGGGEARGFADNDNNDTGTYDDNSGDNSSDDSGDSSDFGSGDDNS